MLVKSLQAVLTHNESLSHRKLQQVEIQFPFYFSYKTFLLRKAPAVLWDCSSLCEVGVPTKENGSCPAEAVRTSLYSNGLEKIKSGITARRITFP